MVLAHNHLYSLHPKIDHVNNLRSEIESNDSGNYLQFGLINSGCVFGCGIVGFLQNPAEGFDCFENFPCQVLILHLVLLTRKYYIFFRFSMTILIGPPFGTNLRRASASDASCSSRYIFRHRTSPGQTCYSTSNRAHAPNSSWLYLQTRSTN